MDRPYLSKVLLHSMGTQFLSSGLIHFSERIKMLCLTIHSALAAQTYNPFLMIISIYSPGSDNIPVTQTSGLAVIPRGLHFKFLEDKWIPMDNSFTDKIYCSKWKKILAKFTFLRTEWY